MPNWNSCTMPVTMPKAKLRRTASRRTGEPLPYLVTPPVGENLHDRDQQRQADSERDEQEVVGDRNAELPAGEKHFHRQAPEVACHA
jgi:hypothetical protein